MIVIKRDATGREVTRYSAEEVLHRDDENLCLRALFTRPQVKVGSIVLYCGDIFTEWFYARRWYNVFRVQDGVTATLKGWYCNFTRPAEIDAEGVAADDLELDLVVTPAREMQLLDLSEYLALELSSAERYAVAAAYREIRQLVEVRECPFHEPT